MEATNNDMQVRMALLKETGYNVEAAQKCWDFVRGDETKKQEPDSDRLADGVYIIQEDGRAFRFVGECTWEGEAAYIGIVQGSHSVAITLHDVSEDIITLTAKVSENDHGGYKDRYMDAVQDWDGEGNTIRLKQIGLNHAIQLKEGDYIPTLAELYLICLNRKAINEALRFVGGQELKYWYWSSTEYSATDAWYLNLNGGLANYDTKTTDTNRVRLVRDFSHR